MLNAPFDVQYAERAQAWELDRIARARERREGDERGQQPGPSTQWEPFSLQEALEKVHPRPPPRRRG